MLWTVRPPSLVNRDAISCSQERNDVYQLDQTDAAFWVQLILSWFTWALLFWSTIAPCCCPNREFGP